MAYTPSSNYLTVRRLWDILSSFKTKIATALGGKQDTLTTQTAYTSKGSATKVPQITTNTLGQVTGITEVTITGVTPSAHAVSTTTYGAGTTSNYGHVKLATGDMNGASHEDGVAVSKNHTHNQYLNRWKDSSGFFNTTSTGSAMWGKVATVTYPDGLDGNNVIYGSIWMHQYHNVELHADFYIFFPDGRKSECNGNFTTTNIGNIKVGYIINTTNRTVDIYGYLNGYDYSGIKLEVDKVVRYHGTDVDATITYYSGSNKTTTEPSGIVYSANIPSDTQIVYDCGTGSTSTTDFSNALAAYTSGKWVIIKKDGVVYHCVGTFNSGLRFKAFANESDLLRVRALTWMSGSAPTAGTQLEASLTGHTHSQYLTSSDITGKMETDGSNATSAAGGNIIRAMSEWSNIAENNEAVPAANITSGGTTQGRYTFASIWSWIISHTKTRILKASDDVYWGVGADSTHAIDLDYDGRTSSPKMGVWVRWGSGDNAKFMAECDASGNCTFNGTSANARYAYNYYYTGGGTAYWIKIGRITSSASSGSAGGALTAIISSGFNTAGDDLSVQIIRVAIRSKGASTNGVTIVGNNVTLGLKSITVNADVRFAVHTVTDRTTSVDGVYDIYVEKKAWHHVDVLLLHNDDVSMTFNSDTTKAISDTTNMTIFSPILPYAGSSESAKEIRIPYGSGSIYLQIGVSGSYLALGTNMADGVMVSYAGEASTAAVAGRLGTASVGSSDNPIYLNNGVPTACNWWVS